MIPQWIFFISPNSVMNDSLKSTRICVVSHDAGGAEVVSSYVKRNGLDCMFSLAGPAVEIFNKKLGRIVITNLDECIEQSDWLLCSMGWGEHEWQALVKAKEVGKRVIVFLDHWTGYKARFERNSEMHLPDEIWVGDSEAEKIAQKTFLNIPIKLVPNPYYADLKDEFNLLPHRTFSSSSGVKILYVCEPTAQGSDESKKSGYTDHDALRYFFKCLSKRNERIDTVCLRPHPAEQYGKYAWALKGSGIKISMGGERGLLEEIVDSDWVVGRSSMALVVGLIVGKKVLSCIPPGGKACSLPHKEILNLELND